MIKTALSLSARFLCFIVSIKWQKLLKLYIVFISYKDNNENGVFTYTEYVIGGYK